MTLNGSEYPCLMQYNYRGVFRPEKPPALAGGVITGG